MFETFTLKQLSEFTEIKGIIHIGAHHGEEHGLYGDLRVLWVEAHPDYAAKLEQNIAWEPYQVAYQALLSDVDDEEVDFYITADEFASSMLEPTLHQRLFAHAQLKDKIKLRTSRFDTFVAREKINVDLYNVLVLDVQGAEIKVLKGIGDLLLDKFPVIITEYAKDALYEGGATLADLDAFLSGYTRKTETHEYIGDALYVRNK